jgi:hypothetical protein
MLRILFVPLVLLSCTRSPAVRVDVSRGVPSSELAITVSGVSQGEASAPVTVIQVASADVRYLGSTRDAIWSVARRPDTPDVTLPMILRYGEVPTGYGGGGPAPRLTNGKYEVRVQSQGVWTSVKFRVTDVNTIE